MNFRFVLIIGFIAVISIFSGYCWALAESMGQGGCNIEQIHSMGFEGNDINVGLIAGAKPRCTHEAFGDPNRVFWYDFGGSTEPNNHDTWVAGVLASEGGLTTHSEYIGVAPKACLHTAAVSGSTYNISDALEELIVNQNCKVIYTAFEFPTLEPNGESTFTKIYDYYAEKYNCFFANPAGNQNQVTVFGDAYNGLTVGGLILEDSANSEVPFIKTGSRSGSGYTSDGRRKPDITAPSQNQTTPGADSDTDWDTWQSSIGATSFSTPYVAGAAALLIEYAEQSDYTGDEQAEVIRAAMVNSAFGNIKNKSGDYTYPSLNSWHPDRGYGRVNGWAAFETLQAGEISQDANTTQTKGCAYNIITQGDINTYKIFADSGQRLKITLTWNRRIEKKGINYTGYLANLDLVVRDPCKAEIFSGLNPKDNLEKCDILVNQPGFHTVEIVNNSTDGEAAAYGLAFEIYPAMKGDYPPFDYKVDYMDLQFLIGDWPLTNDFTDFANICENWLNTDKNYYPTTVMQ
jgi:hypothetical protein